MAETRLLLPGLSPVNGKALSARFDGGALTSDAGLLAIREVERRLDVAGRLATGIDDPRDPTRTVHSVKDILRFRMLLIAAGYEDGIDANALRADPVFKLALERLPGERDLCSEATIRGVENLPDRRMLLRLGRAMVGLYCASFAQVPKRITLDIDDTSRSSSGGSGGDAAHGGQQLRLFNAHYDDYGFQPIIVFDGAGRFVAAVLRPARRPKGREIAAHLRRLIREIRAIGRASRFSCAATATIARPRSSISAVLEAWTSCSASPAPPACGRGPHAALLRGVGRHRIATLEQSTIARVDANRGIKVRRFKEFHDAAASWSRVERIIARVEAGPQGCDTRFIVTNLTRGSGKALHERLYCARGQTENHIEAWKTHLAADRRGPREAGFAGWSNFLHQCRRQPASTVPAWRRLLADVELACRPARPGAMPSSTRYASGSSRSLPASSS